jgi:hypothetical protein
MLLEPICFAKVRTATTAKQAWTMLKDAYEDKGWGRKFVPITLKGSDDARELFDVLYVPDAAPNLLPVNNTVKKGYCMFFSADKGCQIFDSKGCRVTGTMCYGQGRG